MNRLDLVILMGLLSLCMTSCQIYGLTTGINLLSEQDRQKVEDTTLPIDSLTADGKVHIVSMEQIKD